MPLPPPHRFTVRTAWACAALWAAAAAQAASPAPGVCLARSGAMAPTVVELYTSEGCSSCPPADRWLSTLKGQPGVLALAFHVNYWDRLGWPDRFASAEATARQHELAQRAGSRNVYTPQVIANGRDWRFWPKLPTADAAAAAATPVSLTLSPVRWPLARTPSSSGFTRHAVGRVASRRVPAARQTGRWGCAAS